MVNSGVLELLVANPLLTLFVVAAGGYLVGRVRLAGFSLGMAAVLFCGLGAGALDARLALPELVPQFGLVLFVYTIGLSSGPGFFASFRQRGLRESALAAVALVVGAGATLVAAHLLDLDAAYAAGLFAGSLTNTPALAAVVEQLDAAARDAPVIAYSIAYPLGVLGPIAAVALVGKLRAAAADEVPAVLASRTVRVLRPEACVEVAAAVLARHGLEIVIGRLRRGEAVRICDEEERLEIGDLVTLVGTEAQLARAVEVLGEPVADPLELDRRVVDFRRVFVSSRAVAGRSLGELDLHQRFGATATRVRRGDVDLLAGEDLVLELGDRVRVVAPRERLPEISAFFGDSLRALAEIDVITFGLGICLGLLVGLVSIPLPGGAHFALGFAGGPLVLGLVLGRLGRTGPLVWHLPYEANLTLRQVGLVLFLAGVGTRSGRAFASLVGSTDALPLLGAALAITAATAAVVVVGGRVLGLAPWRHGGVIAGVHTQPAVLAFASERAGNDLPGTGYTSVFPTAMIVKIVLAQLLLAWL